jgi:chromatin remodeling complex protein RSC6
MATAKKPAAKKPAAKKAAAKKPVAKKAAAKKPVAKKAAPAKKAAAKKPVAKKAPAKKAAAKKPAAPRKPNAAFMKPVTPSAVLAAVIGGNPAPRTEITKKVWDYIKKFKLQNATNKRMIDADDKLKAVFGGKKQVSMFEMTKLISGHLKYFLQVPKKNARIMRAFLFSAAANTFFNAWQAGTSYATQPVPTADIRACPGCRCSGQAP